MKPILHILKKIVFIVLLGVIPSTIWAAEIGMSIGDASITEGDSGTSNMTFTVSTSATVGVNVGFNYTITPGTATNPADFTGSLTGSGTIASGTSSTTFTVPIVGDLAAEGTETFTVVITSSLPLYDNTAVGTITDNDTRSLSVNDVSVAEGATGVSNVSLTVTLTGNTASVNLPFTFSTTNNTAIAGSDYTQQTAVSGTILAGTSSATITVPIMGDIFVEPTETFNVVLSSTTPIGDGTGVITITDSDKYILSIAPVTNNSVNEGTTGATTNATYKVTANQPITSAISVNYATAGSGGNPATSGTDFTATSGALNFVSGDTEKTITVPIKGDVTPEPNEAYTITLSGQSANSTLGTATATGTILNDDSGTLSISQSGTTVAENAGTKTYTVTLSASPTGDVTVNYATADAGATAGSDYTAKSGTLTFASGTATLSQTFTVSIINDTAQEASKNYTVNLSGATNATISIATVTTTITDDDGRTLAISPTTHNTTEGDVGSTNATYTVTLSGTPLNAVTVNYTTANGTANSGSDYTTTTGVLNFAAGATGTGLVKTFTVPILGDTTPETNENFTVTLSGATNAGISAATSTETIVNDDSPTISINSVSQNEGITPMAFTVTLSAAQSANVTVQYQTSNGTATAGSDYTAQALTTLTFTPGQTSKTVNVTIAGDLVQEADETFNVTLSAPTGGATLGTSVGIGTILNDDTVSLEILPVTLDTVEGNSGVTNAIYTVKLSAIPYNEVTVHYATANGTATAGSDYTNTFGDFTFTAGTTVLTKTITVPISGDTTVEPNETYTVTLSAPTNATITTATATGTILNDDTTISINDTTVSEGPCVPQSGNLTVTLSQAVSYNVVVNYSSGGGSATAGSDYTAISGSITIPAGSTSGQIPVSVNNDAVVDAGETFNVTITSPAGITITDAVGVVTITDNQSRDITAFNNRSVTEGDVGQKDMTFTVSLCQASASNITLNYSTSNTGSNPATENTDYVSGDGGTVTIPAGSLSADIIIKIKGDLIQEPTETFRVTLSGAPAGVTITDTRADGSIIDNDNRNLSINDVTVTEGNSGTTNATLRITMSAAAAAPVIVNYSTKNGTATTGDSDYVSQTGSLTFAVGGALFQDVTFLVNGDTKVEGSEYFEVNISTPSGVTVSDNTGQVDITDDDNRTLTLGGTNSYPEGNSNNGINLTATLSSVSPVDRIITYSTVNGTASGGSDFIAVSNQSVTIPAGTATVNLPITLIGDFVYETSEAFTVTIASADGLAIAGSPRTVTITNDDGRLSINDQSLTEGDTGTKDMTFTVSLSPQMSSDVNVTYSTTDGSALVGDNDYNATSGTLEFLAGQTSKTFVVKINGDTTYEPDETFNVTIANAQGVTLLDNTGQGEIRDDDARTITITSPTYNETESNTSRNFTIAISASSLNDVNLTFATADGTASAGLDYIATSGTIIIPAGSTSVTLPVTTIGDFINEPTENFTLSLTTAMAGITLPAPGTMTITNDDGNLTITPAVSNYEGNTSTTPFTFNVTLSQPSGSVISVPIATRDGNATVVGSDYSANSGTLIFGAGETSKQFTVLVNGDIAYEGDEYFEVNISNTQGVILTNDVGRANILDDDGRTVYVVNSSHNEGDVGETTTNVTVQLSQVSGTDLMIDYELFGNTATGGTDFNLTSGTVSIPAGATTTTIPVTVYGDLTFEPNETVDIVLTPITAGFVASPSFGTFTITNDDGVLTIGNSTIAEGNTSTVTLGDVNVTLSRVSTVDINVSYTMIAGSATADVDYNATGGMVTIPAGATTVSIPLTIFGDASSEGDETFIVRISNTQGVTISDSDGVITIHEDDLDTMEIFDRQRPFSLRLGKNIYGNYTATGAPIMCAINTTTGACDWNYNGTLASSTTKFLNDASMAHNSSSADLNVSMNTGDKVLWAGLYWQGHIESNNAEDLDNNTSGWNTVKFKTPNGTTYTKTADLADNRQTNYYAFQAASSAANDGFRFFYQGYADVTSEVNASLSLNAGRTFSVGEMKATVGTDRVINDPALDGGNGAARVGHFGGWSLVVVYEKGDKTNPDDLHNVSIYDGYQYLVANNINPVKSVDIGVSGFRTPSSVEVGKTIDSQLLYFGGGGEKGMTGDEMNISNKSGVFNTVFDTKNPANNPFNDTIAMFGADLNATRVYNPGIDLDAIQVGQWLDTNQSSTTIRLSAKYTTESDQTFAGVVGFSTQLYQPQLCYDFTYRQNGVYIKNAIDSRELPTIRGYVTSAPITAGIYLKNTDSDFAIQGLSLFTDMNGSKITYTPDTTKTTKANTSVLQIVSETEGCSPYITGSAGTQACRSDTAEGAGKNIRTGLGNGVTGYTKNSAGDLDSGEFVYTQFKLDPFGLSGDVNESIGLKINYFIDLGDGEIDYEYTLGTHVKLCPPNPGYYAPTWGILNVVDRKYSDPADAAMSLPYNNLRTQVSREPFEVDVAMYKKNDDNITFGRPTSNINTTVMVEIIDSDAFHDVNASCANPDSNLTQPIFVPLTITATDITDPVTTQDASYYNFAVQNGAFRIWYFTDNNNTLIQNWSAATSGGSQNKTLTGISGLYQAGIHAECSTQCLASSSLGCFDCIKTNYSKALCSRDNFSVRPEAYDMRIFDINKSLSYNSADKNNTRIDLSDSYGYIPTDGGIPDSTTGRMNLAAGYTYRYDLNATGHNTDSLAAIPGYTRYFRGSNSDYNATMVWEPRPSKITTGCNDTASRVLIFDVVDGEMLNQEQNQTQVGDYRLNMIDKIWTKHDIDANLTQHHTAANGFVTSGVDAVDCEAGDNGTIAGTDPSAKNGCEIGTNHINGSHLYKDHKLTFKPAKFDLSTIVYGLGANMTSIASGGEGFVYNSDLSNANDMNMSVRISGAIKAVGDNGEELSNFVRECYATDMNVSVEHNASSANRFVGRVIASDISGFNPVDSLEYDAGVGQPARTIAQSSFAKLDRGQVSTAIRLNVDRNQTTPLEPQIVHYTDINTTCVSSSDCNISAMTATVPNTAQGSDSMDFNVTHVYGRVKANDIRVMGTIPFDATARYEVFETPTLLGTALKAGSSENNWYINSLHDESKDGDSTVPIVYPMDANASLSSSSGYASGIETFHFNAFGDRKGRTGHIDTQGWLWNGGATALPYVDPSMPTSAADNTAKCLTHPCFKILFGKTIGSTGSAKTESEAHKDNKESSSGTGWKSTSEYAPAIQ